MSRCFVNKGAAAVRLMDQDDHQCGRVMLAIKYCAYSKIFKALNSFFSFDLFQLNDDWESTG